MEEFKESNLRNTELLEKRFNSYMKDLPLTPEDLRNPLLDVGTGKGDFIKYLREVLGNKSAIGVERSASKIDENYEGLIVADGMDLPFDDESFDTVTSHNYLPMFVSDPIKMQTAIEEQLRVVKEGGKIMGDIHTPESVTACDAELRQNLGSDYTKRDEEISKEQYEGAEKLQQYLKSLNPEEYKVEFVGSSDKTVVVITKLKYLNISYTKVFSKEEMDRIKQENMSDSLDIMDVQSLEKQMEENPEDSTAILNKSIDKFLEIFENLYKVDRYKLAVFITLIRENNWLSNAIELKGENTSLSDYYEGLVLVLKNKTINKEQWLAFLRGYKKYLEKQNEWLIENREDLVTNFISQFDERINPLLTKPVSIEEIEEILRNNEIRLSDILNFEHDGLHNFSGIIYIGLANLVTLDHTEEEAELILNQIFNHETLHAITGGQAVQRNRFDGEEEDEYGVRTVYWSAEGDEEWSGLQVHQFKGKKFIWLNEAITESLATVSTGGEPIAYPEEIKLFNLICEKGKINPQIFYDAYFEKKGRLRNKNSDRNFWNELIKKLNEAFPMRNKKFLVCLDDIIREDGIERGLEFVLNEEWKK
ncbi:MAG: ubiE/COQ5 methyltransferase family [Candidatus Parcubacteria bacterium]|jgi:ubiquinone/menaquinone biosynthesis C-methylase UbiE